MVDLGNGNGVREPGELWGYCGGIAGERVRDRNPIYVAPADATLNEVIYRSAPTGVYFDNVPQWAVTMEFANGSRLYLIKWRDVGYRDASGVQRAVYQWASYVLSSDGLKIAFGPFLDVPAAGSPPGVSAATPCNGTTVVCFDHVEKPGY